ncbi:AAA family ATPase [Kerstersia similis]|uniref:AAA family ATPase n=1 Tax=Kerstersia similis TaxID=206505 RepID=UPI0039EFBBAB
MKLTRIRLESFRRFRQPLEITGLTPGLNLFAAPNEAGKSTVAEAIRAAFLERHRSSSVAYLRPWDEPSATPQVEVDFVWQGREYRLAKTFMGRKRCHLLIDGKALDGAEAEDYLAELIGFRFARKGASDAADMGVPGLLWIRQGDAHDLTQRVRHAGQHLRDALSDSLGELSASEGDEVLAQVREARAALLHAATGAPKGDYAAALKQSESLIEEVRGLEQRIALFHEDIDRLSKLRVEHAQARQQRPWEQLAQEREQAQARLQQAEGLAEKRRQALERLRQCQAQVGVQQLRVEHLRQQELALNERQAALLAAQQRSAAARAELQRQEQLAAQASQARTEAQAELDAARQRQRVAEVERQAQAAQRQVEQLTLRLAQAEAAQASWREREAQARQERLAPEDIKRLERLEQAARLAQARLEAAATTVEYALDAGVEIDAGDERLSGSGRRTLATATTWQVAGLGSLRILPGGSELETLRDNHARLQQELASLLQELGVADAGAAQARARRYDQLQAQAEAARQVAASYAPQGNAVLQQELQNARLQWQEATQWLAQRRSVAVDAHAMPALEVAEATARQVQHQHDRVMQSLQDSRLQAGVSEAELTAAQAEWQRAQAALTAPDRDAEQRQALMDLANARSDEAQAQSHLEALEAQLASLDLDFLRQDVQRLADSEAIQRQRYQERERLLAELGSRLETMGSTGLEEDLADRRLQLEQARRRAGDLARRAQALDYLLASLEAARGRMMRRLHAPLQKHLDRYLRILFPGASVELDDELVPGQIRRAGSQGLESGALADLSHGAREQIGVLARLAYADLLQEAGRPSLVILDDALVHSDEGRLGQMKRVLYDAARRHQILIFTCHPAAWEDLGVASRSLQAA